MIRQHPLPADDDPFAILRLAADTAPAQVVSDIESALGELELDAIATAKPAQGADDVVSACHETGRAIIVVSNNSGHAVESYLRRRGMLERVDLIVGRASTPPALADALTEDRYLASYLIQHGSHEETSVRCGQSRRPALCARIAICTRLASPSLLRMLLTCAFTVASAR